MFKKSPKNCFKPVLPLIIQNGTKGQECENHAETQKSTNGPNMSYYNYFLLPQIDVVIGPNADYVPLELKGTQRIENNVYVS